MTAITTCPARMLLLSGALLTCACEQQTTTLDDALRAYDAKRYAESLRISKDIQGNATDPLTRQQAAYMVGRSASELSKNREARDAFSVAARSSDPQLAGRALAMQAAIAVDEKRWSDAASSYSAAASKLSGQEAQIARERAQRADAKANESRLPPRPATAIEVIAAAPQPPAAPKTTTPRAPQVAPAPAPVAVTGPRADVLAAAHAAAEAAVRLIKPGNTNAQVTEAVAAVAAAYGVTPAQGVLMHQMKRCAQALCAAAALPPLRRRPCPPPACPPALSSAPRPAAARSQHAHRRHADDFVARRRPRD
jgi:hypothetical protein